MHAALRAYANYIRVNATRARQVEQVGPFIATFTQHTANPFLNYAIPLDGAAPTDDDVRALIGAFRRRGRMPRVEYFPVLAPEVAQRLDAAGFTIERRIPVMVCTPEDLRPIPVPDGVAMNLPACDEEYLAAASAQHDAFEELQPASPDDAARLRRLAEGGGVVMVAAVEATGEAAGAGVCDAIHNGLGELAGIGVRARFRRRGIAAAITHRLAQAAFAAGAATVLLTPGGPAEQRIYQRVGFTALAEQAHVSLQSAGQAHHG
ncbi:MAG TPA: GNAT family N-acetyltransferase [Actinomycetes bacterium]|jgi:ribosomal protein S18 acetylase RimI-like enzyme|nr:GNAT family N-acetyltransferase [Actinomycetes bacterium]